MSHQSQGAPESVFYYQLLHADEAPEVLPTAFQRASAVLQAADGPAPPSLPHALRLTSFDTFAQDVHDARKWWPGMIDELAHGLAAVTPQKCAEVFLHEAPLALLSGCWLQNVSSAATAHEEIPAAMLGLYAREIGAGEIRHHRGVAYRELMSGLGAYLPEVDSIAFAQHPELPDACFSYPAFLLSIAQFPRSFLPELLGITLFRYVCGTSPILLCLRDVVRSFGVGTKYLDWLERERSDGTAGTATSLVTRFMRAEASCSEQELELRWRRVRRGFFSAACATIEGLNRGLALLRAPAMSCRDKMLQLLRRKARHARGYHSAVMLEGKSLDDWLSVERGDHAGLLEALARSPLVFPGNARESALLRRSVAFGGPMFRVFSPEELTVIEEWINSLPEALPVGPSPRVGPEERIGSPPMTSHMSPPPWRTAIDTACRPATSQPYSRLAWNELYYVLLNVEQHPDVRPHAKHVATRWLSLAERELDRGPRAIPFEQYGHGSLEDWVEQQHRRQVESYRPGQGAPSLSREQLIQSTIQQAPMILIDGSWVQNAFKSGRCHTQIASTLFRIYFDEVGNGSVDLNHANVFRKLLAQMGVVLPPIESLEFSRWPGFRPESFRVPVFWLCLSMFPKRFMPETLGLNLAMELSGVGGTYRSAADALRYHGFDSCFIELHNTIDNVSTGHTAWARDAIKCYMDEILVRGGADLVHRHWRRVWTGYRALIPPAPPGVASRMAHLFARTRKGLQ